MRALSRLAVVVFVSVVAPSAIGCPDCPEGIRRQVNAGIFDGAFIRNVAAAALPFGVLAAIGAAVHAGAGARQGGSSRRRHA